MKKTNNDNVVFMRFRPVMDAEAINEYMGQFIEQIRSFGYRDSEIEYLLFAGFQAMAVRHLPKDASFHQEAHETMRALAGYCVERFNADITDDGQVSLPYRR